MSKKTRGLSKAALAKLAPAHYTTLSAHPTSFGLAPTAKEQGIAESINSMLASVAAGETVDVPPDLLAEFGIACATKLKKALTARKEKRPPKTLYMSEVGEPCARKLWYKVNDTDEPEAHKPETLVKFLYGDLLEDVVLTLAKLAGNRVEGEQESLVLDFDDGWQVRGKRDALINGKEWDVKTASGYATKKFKDGLDDSNDTFGYRRQLQSYAEVSGKPVGGFLVINKETGEITDHTTDKNPYILKELDAIILAVDSSEVFMPTRYYKDSQDLIGNWTLPSACSYCNYKWKCWQDANGGEGLRMFKYSNKIVYMTKVVSEPRVEEIKPWLAEASSGVTEEKE